MFSLAKPLSGSVVAAPVRPGLRYGTTPLRKNTAVHSTPLDRWVVRLRSRILPTRVSLTNEWLIEIKNNVVALESLSTAQCHAQFKQLASVLLCKGHDAQSLDTSLAHAVLTARRTLEINPHDVQLIGVRELLRGRFVEMGTGEGKTLTMALAAAVSALDRTPVHVLTASDYLAERDATWLSPLYQALGLSVAFVAPEMSEVERAEAYRADVVHVTGKQVAFDWLRDNVATEGSTQRLSTRLGNLTSLESDANVTAHSPLLRGLCLAIIDEADSLLIDEARTPLVLAAPMSDNKDEREECVVALTLARLLHEGVDFEVSSPMRLVTLTSEGENSLDKLALRVDGLWRAARYRDEKVRDALNVLHCWHRDRDYVVRDNRIELVDPHTGRALRDRRLQRGLHTLLELKERCETTPENDVVASLPFQHFFRNYVRIAGMSGTLREVRAELATVYNVDVVCLPPDRPSQLREMSARVFPTTCQQLEALVQEIRNCLNHERPVLIGTRTVEQSERVSSVLKKHAIDHQLLNACQDANEAVVIAEAGIAGQVTVATNMAGRGTDIRLGLGVPECGGLHVISLAFNDSYRLDRQLAGRAGRQGDPGSFVRLLSLDDLSLKKESTQWLIKIVKRLLAAQTPLQFSFASSKAICSGRMSQLCDKEDCTVCRSPIQGMGIANDIALLLLKYLQYKVERKHASERQSALNACKQLTHHIAIGAKNKFNS